MNHLSSWLNLAYKCKIRSPTIGVHQRQLSSIWNKPKYELMIQKSKRISSLSEKYYSKDSDYGRQLGGFEYKDELPSFRSLWRKPLIEREGFWKSKLSLFAKKKYGEGRFKLLPENYQYLSVVKYMKRKTLEHLIHDQQFIEERLKILGCDLTAAHFVVFRGGAVKFCGHSEWIRDDKKTKRDYDDNLPNCFTPGYILEGIDFSGTNIIYEGFKNIENLSKLTWLSFAFCPFFDNWFLDRVSGQYGDSLEYLDLSYTNISVHALGALYRFRKLKTLKLFGFSENPEFLLLYEELKQEFPDMTIEGIVNEQLSETSDKTLKVDCQN